MALPQETPFFIDRGESQLFAVQHPAAGAIGLPYLFCHPFGEEKLWTHRVFVGFARALASRGHVVLRLDFRGNGDSSGSFADSSISTALADIGAGIDLLRSRTGAERVGLLGLRLGATLAYTTAAQRADVESLVLWSPIVDGRRYLQELLRINLTTQLAVYREVREDREALVAALARGQTVNVDGYEIGPAMGKELGALSLLGDAPAPTARCLLAQIGHNQQAAPSRELEALQSRMTQATLQVTQEEPFWKEIPRFYTSAPNLFATTLQWMGHQ
jgi:uncharacterized protein